MNVCLKARVPACWDARRCYWQWISFKLTHCRPIGLSWSKKELLLLGCGCSFLFGSSFRGGFLQGLFHGAGTDALGITQIQSTLGAERVLPDRGLSGCGESDVNTAALGQHQGASVAGKHALLCRREAGVLLNGRLDLVSGHRRSCFFAQTLRIDVACVNTLRDEEGL